MFDHGWVNTPDLRLSTDPGVGAAGSAGRRSQGSRPGRSGKSGSSGALDRGELSAVVQQLQQRIRSAEDGLTRTPLPLVDGLNDLAAARRLAGVLPLRSGGCYQVAGATLSLLLAAGPTQAGQWTAVIGDHHLGVEAAAELGVNLERLVLIPDPGPDWVEVTAAMIDVAALVVLHPPADLTAKVGSVLRARLRKRSAVLLSTAPCPGADASLWIERTRWSGVEQGAGLLQERTVTLAARRGSAPVIRADLRLVPGEPARLQQAVEEADVAVPTRPLSTAITHDVQAVS